MKVVIPENVSVHPGMAVTLSVNTLSEEKKQGVYTVPAGSLYYDESGAPCLWKVDEDQMRVKKTPVIIGDITGTSVPVLKGIFEKDMIVIAGAQFLRENQKVRIFNKKPENG